MEAIKALLELAPELHTHKQVVLHKIELYHFTRLRMTRQVVALGADVDVQAQDTKDKCLGESLELSGQGTLSTTLPPRCHWLFHLPRTVSD